MTEIVVRTCAWEKCGQPFTPKPKGMRQRYCKELCRVYAWQQRNPRAPEVSRHYSRAFEARNRERRNAAALARYHRKCECGKVKPSADADMCLDCAAMDRVSKARQLEA